MCLPKNSFVAYFFVGIIFADAEYLCYGFQVYMKYDSNMSINSDKQCWHLFIIIVDCKENASIVSQGII